MDTDSATVTMASAVIDDRQILQADLARVNLLRIRGDVSSSKALCLSILKRYPESIDAHVMMGDLHAEQGDLAPAAEWYSLALDLDRFAPGVSVKLARVQAALDISGQASRSRALILTGKKMSPWLYMAVISSAMAVLSVAYLAGMGSSTKNATAKKPVSERIESPKVNDPVIRTASSTPSNTVAIPTVTAADPGPVPSSIQNPTTIPETKSTGGKETVVSVVDDQKLFEQITNRSLFGKHIISIIADPRSKGMVLTYNVAQGEHGRYMGAILAAVALEYDAKTLSVTVRGVRGGVLSYIADVPREKVMAVQEREKKNVQDLDDKGWIDEVLTNEYFKAKEANKTPSF